MEKKEISKNAAVVEKEFYQRDNILLISQELIGKWVFTQMGEDEITGGMIIDVEAYAGLEDKACHAYNNRRTPRTEVMFQAGGVAYVYLCYGMHCLLNFITHTEGMPGGIMIRAIHPTQGIATMEKRRNKKGPTLTSGPGSVCRALGITRALNGHDLTQPPLWVEDRKTVINPQHILSGPRINIDYAEEHAELPWRFYLSPLAPLNSN